jgi:hypothetical protein
VFEATPRVEERKEERRAERRRIMRGDDENTQERGKATRPPPAADDDSDDSIVITVTPSHPYQHQRPQHHRNHLVYHARYSLRLANVAVAVAIRRRRS